MSYNGSGTFQINTTGQPVVAGTVISSTAFNALTADLATGLSTAITKDGQTATTARIPFAAGISSTLVTDSTSISTGSIITAGGAGIAKALYVGTTANIAGVLSTTSPNITTSITTPSTSFDLINATATTLNLGGAATAVNVGAATGTMTVANTTLAAKAITASTTLGVTGTTTLTGVATLTANPVLSAGTANGVTYLNGSKSLTSGTGLVFDGTNSRLSINQSSSIFGAQLEVTASTGGQAVGIHGRAADGLSNIVFGANGAGTEYARIQSDNTSSLQFGAGSTGATKMTLTSNGVLALSGASTSATGTGITFPATQSASTDANTLDDYEEGTFTVAVTMGTGSVTVSSSSNTLFYTKIGRQVTISGLFIISAISTPSGTMSFNLPFATNAGTQNSSFYAGSVRINNQALPTGLYALVHATSSSSTADIYLMTSAGAVSNVVPAVNGQFTVTLTYFV